MFAKLPEGISSNAWVQLLGRHRVGVGRIVAEYLPSLGFVAGTLKLTVRLHLDIGCQVVML